MQDHRDGCQDGLAPEEEDLDRRQWDVLRPERNASDAWDGVRRDVVDAAGLRRELADEAAEKLAARALDGRAQDAWLLQREHH